MSFIFRPGGATLREGAGCSRAGSDAERAAHPDAQVIVMLIFIELTVLTAKKFHIDLARSV
jgi:hypothetical protein